MMMDIFPIWLKEALDPNDHEDILTMMLCKSIMADTDDECIQYCDLAEATVNKYDLSQKAITRARARTMVLLRCRMTKEEAL